MASAATLTPTFTFETTLLRGRNEVEHELTVEYLFDGTGHPTLWKASIPVSGEEWNQLADQVADRCDADFLDEFGDLPAREVRAA